MLEGSFNFNSTPLALPGTKVIIHKKPNQQRQTWGTHGINGWYLGPSREHYRGYQVFACKIKAECNSDDVEFFPQHTPKSPLNSSMCYKIQLRPHPLHTLDMIKWLGYKPLPTCSKNNKSTNRSTHHRGSRVQIPQHLWGCRHIRYPTQSRAPSKTQESNTHPSQCNWSTNPPTGLCSHWPWYWSLHGILTFGQKCQTCYQLEALLHEQTWMPGPRNGSKGKMNKHHLFHPTWSSTNWPAQGRHLWPHHICGLLTTEERTQLYPTDGWWKSDRLSRKCDHTHSRYDHGQRTRHQQDHIHTTAGKIHAWRH